MLGDQAQVPIKLRLIVAAAIAFAYCAAPAPFLLMGAMGLWWITLLLFAGLPFLLLALVVGVVFAGKIIEAPWNWAISAGLGAVVVSCAAFGLGTGQWQTGLFAIPIAVFGPVVFGLTSRLFFEAFSS